MMNDEPGRHTPRRTRRSAGNRSRHGVGGAIAVAAARIDGATMTGEDLTLAKAWLKACPSLAAIQRHRRHGEPACPACTALRSEINHRNYVQRKTALFRNDWQDARP